MASLGIAVIMLLMAGLIFSFTRHMTSLSAIIFLILVVLFFAYQYVLPLFFKK